MARIMLGNMNPRRDFSKIVITDDFASNVSGGLVKLFSNQFNAYILQQNNNQERSCGKLSIQMEFVNRGFGLVEVNYIPYNCISTYLSCSTELVGHEELWGENSSLVRKIQEYYSKVGLKMYKHEICTREGPKFVSGAEWSAHITKSHGHELAENK